MGACISVKKEDKIDDTIQATQPSNLISENAGESEGANVGGARARDETSVGRSPARRFTFGDLCAATGTFNDTNKIGEGGFGKVYKGRLDTGEIIAIKQLNQKGDQGSEEFITEVLMLNVLHHPNLVNLLGYCADGDQKLLIYEYMPKGSLEDHLFDLAPNQVPLDWNTRMKIAVGAARGLEYLQCSVSPPVILRDLKPGNILLDDEFNARLSDFGLAKFGPVGDNTHVSTHQIMGTLGYSAPEYLHNGRMSVRSDVFSLGVVLMELVTGRKAVDYTRPPEQRNFVDLCRPFFTDRRRFRQLADTTLRGRYPPRCYDHAITIAVMCLQVQPNFRPAITDVRVALEYIASQPYVPDARTSRSRSSFPSPSIRGQGRY